MIHFIAFWLLLFGTCGYALLRGDRPERNVAWMLLAAAFATVIVRRGHHLRYVGLETGVAIVDLLLLAGLVWVATESVRIWPIIVAALQVVTVLGHLGRAINPHVLRLGYAMAITLPAYPMLLTLGSATALLHVRRRRRSAEHTSSGSSPAGSHPIPPAPPID